MFKWLRSHQNTCPNLRYRHCPNLALMFINASLTWLSAVGEAAGAPPPVAGMLLLMLSWLTVGDCGRGERGGLRSRR